MKTHHIDIKRAASLVAEVAILLISNGANSTRTQRNVLRITDTYGYNTEIFFSFSGIMLTITDAEGNSETVIKTVKSHGVDFNLITEISILTWDIFKKNMKYEEIQARIADIKRKPHYGEWTKMIWIGLATGALCMIFSGNYEEFFIAFLAGSIGFLVKLFLIKKRYNPFMICLMSAFVSASVVQMAVLLGFGSCAAALTACVLWLIPGVPLINGCLDLLEGHIVSGWARVALGSMLVFMIAVGYYFAVFIFKYFSYAGG
ncbi:threonine/serine exporter family protein [Riemerella columbipharyngis]|uniref:Uncharacterized membrane protein YjjP, DUF1212 family n=1 Tax=Riemerella columbipharyngis TaxID=1071918 RepID=A0A1G7EU76_9FLAO|nr:threonine/serine exporter family protein [Riemerella columbipharyngis]SDE67137.1 Uncharacterized membrane protein YjjP, DUF1212 family [Riemerella columbipharyngis]